MVAVPVFGSYLIILLCLSGVDKLLIRMIEDLSVISDQVKIPSVSESDTVKQLL